MIMGKVGWLAIGGQRSAKLKALWEHSKQHRQVEEYIFTNLRLSIGHPDCQYQNRRRGTKSLFGGRKSTAFECGVHHFLHFEKL
jgi:hypothetical protein